MVVTCMPNSDHERASGTPFMTIFGSYVGCHFPNIQYFNVYGGVWRYIKLFGSICRYLEVYEGIWRYISIYEPTFSTFFFQLFGGPLFRHCFFSTCWWSSFSTLFFFNLLVVHFVDIFCSAFLKVWCLSREIARRMPSESCLGTPWGPSYEHTCKNVYLKRDRIGW